MNVKRAHLTVALSFIIVGVGSAQAQPLTRRSPNIQGTWVTSPWNLNFAFNHRFRIIGDEDITDIFGEAFLKNSPTFNLALGLWAPFMTGVMYSSEPAIINGTKNNEWFPYLKWAPWRSDGASVSLLGGYNSQAESADGVLAGDIWVNRFGLLGEVRAFSDALHSGEAGLALAGGLVFRITEYIVLAADVAGFVAGPDSIQTATGATDPGLAWSLGINFGIPFTPHTVSFQVSNALNTMPQEASYNSAETRGSDLVWGFEFTVPFSGFARWSRLFDSVQTAEGPDGPPPRLAEIEMKRMRFDDAQVLVSSGASIRWVNRDPVVHTIAGNDGTWRSPLVGPGETFTSTRRASSWWNSEGILEC
jgi:plastocyanin